MGITELDKFNNDHFEKGASWFKVRLWYTVNSLFFKSGMPFCFCKIIFLKMFGAKVGKGVVIKPSVNIKYPWNLTIGDHVWVGEKVWIDNLDQVDIGSHACISQGALILSGNHNYKKKTFDLMTKPIVIKDGAWICARSTVTQGVTCGFHSVLGISSVASSDLEDYGIYSGNPAVKIRERRIEE
jgi:putative colanic acid biosynthesis acetyltransferase WcaF